MDRTTFRDEIIILQKLDKLHIARSTIYLLKLKRVRTRILMRVASYFQQLFIFLRLFLLKSRAGVKRAVGQLVKVGMVGVVRDHENRKN